MQNTRVKTSKVCARVRVRVRMPHRRWAMCHVGDGRCSACFSSLRAAVESKAAHTYARDRVHARARAGRSSRGRARAPVDASEPTQIRECACARTHARTHA
eukprot:6181919-Pleurochrysis_carterae.AAC.3